MCHRDAQVKENGEHTILVRSALCLILFGFFVLHASTDAAEQVNDDPLLENWAPAEWGDDDKIGAVNRITPQHVLDAVALVKQGKVATLGKVYSEDMPLYGERQWKFRIVNMPPDTTWGNLQGFPLDDYVETAIGQVGTQFDGPGHIGVRTSKGYYFYNGRYLSDPDITAHGLGPLGVEHVAEKGFVCRGVLLNATLLDGNALAVPKKPSIDDPGILAPDDIEELLELQELGPIREGDCVFLYTGHGDLWDTRVWPTLSDSEKKVRSEQFMAGEPGFGLSACQYLASRKIILTGSDTWATEAFDPAGKGESNEYLECHIELQTKSGIWNLENLDFSRLLADEAYEFLFVWSPLKIKGGTGSPGNPVAIY